MFLYHLKKEFFNLVNFLGVCKGNKPLFLESLLRGGKGDVQLIFLSKLLLGHSYITIYTNWAYTSQLSKKQNKKQY